MKITKGQAQKIVERYKEADKDDSDYMSFGQSANAITDILIILGIQYKFGIKQYFGESELIILDVEEDAE